MSVYGTGSDDTDTDTFSLNKAIHDDPSLSKSIQSQLPFEWDLPSSDRQQNGPIRVQMDLMTRKDLPSALAIFNEMLFDGQAWPFIEESFNLKKYLNYYCSHA